MSEFRFNEYKPFTDGEIEVVLSSKRPAEQGWGRVPAYYFNILRVDGRLPVGTIDLRVGDTEHIVMYAGNIGYGIAREHRGNHYAARACNLIKEVAIDHGFDTLWITCNPDNWASRRTCEILGCELVEIVDLPQDMYMYRMGDRQKCRYRWDL
jgi:tagatose 1,6-diphosphate aldolase